MGKIAVLCLLLVGCASRPPVTLVCEQPDLTLIVPLTVPQADNLGELEDVLVEFVRKTLPADNARKEQLIRQLERLRTPR